MIESFKVYVLVVALSINDNIKFLENIKQGFKKKFLGTKIHWNNNANITSSLWNYYRDEIHNTNNNSSHGKSFEHKKVVGKKAAQPGNERAANWPVVATLNVEITIPLKYLINFSRFLDLPPINCGIELIIQKKPLIDRTS